MIQVIDNFNYKGEKSNFARDQFSTYQDMQNFPDYHLDDGHISYCVEKKQHYTYNKQNRKWIELKKVPLLQEINNKLYYSYDGENYNVASDYIAAWFRMKDNKFQITRDKLVWEDLSEKIENNLYIKNYIKSESELPVDATQGSIYMVGPTYNSDDTDHTNPIYKLYIKNYNGYINSGSFQSISAGVVQKLGGSETEVVSQKAATLNFKKVTPFINGEENMYIRELYINFDGIDEFKNFSKYGLLYFGWDSNNSRFTFTIAGTNDDYETYTTISYYDNKLSSDARGNIRDISFNLDHNPIIKSYLSSYKLLTAKSSKSLNFPNVELISKNAYPPADCSFSMFYPNEALEKYPDRKSYLGWVINTKQQMEKQIELASSHGIDYFMFCFYIPSNIKEAIDNEGNIAFDVIESSSYNNAIYKFLEAENNYKMKFCIMLCDHGNRLNEKTLHQMLSYINTKFVQHNQYLYMNGRAVVSFFDLSFADKVKNCHKINNSLLLLNTFNPIHGGFNGRMSYAGAIPNNIGLYSYETLSTFNVGKINSTYKLIPSLLDIPTVAVGRNEFPRADFITKNQSNNYAFLDPTKQQFLDQLKNVIDILPDFSTEDQSILIYAWNELGEGGFLLPTRGLTTTEANDYPLLGDDMQQEFNDENKALYYDLYKLQAVKEVKEYWNSK